MTLSATLRRFALALSLVALCHPAGAQEQRIVAVVNDDIVSNFDIDGRTSLQLISTGAPDTPDSRARMRPQILRQLIDERIQLQEAKRLGLTIPRSEIDESIKRIESSNNLPPGGLDQIFRRAGVPRGAMDKQIEAAMAWQRLIGGRLRSQVEVSREEVNEVLDRYTHGDPVTEYQLSEIFFAVDNPEQEDDIRRTIDEIVGRLKTGAIPYFVAAQQFSQSASAAEGGDIGWVQRGQFDPEIEDVLARIDVGQMTPPIRVPSGFYLYAMRDKRVLAPASPDDARVDIAQIVFPVPPNAAEADRASVQSLAETVRETVLGCADLDRVADEMKIPPPVRVSDVRIGDLAAATRDRIRPLKVNETSELAPTDGGFGMAMVCVRTEPQSNLPTASDIEDNLIRQRLDTAARRYLRDLRRVAVVDIRA